MDWLGVTFASNALTEKQTGAKNFIFGGGFYEPASGGCAPCVVWNLKSIVFYMLYYLQPIMWLNVILSICCIPVLCCVFPEGKH